MAVKIPLVLTEDPALKLFQTQLGKVLSPILENPLNYGAILTSITLTSGVVNAVPTTINRNYQGWVIVRMRAQATVWEDATQDSPDKIINLRTSATVVADILVF